MLGASRTARASSTARRVAPAAVLAVSGIAGALWWQWPGLTAADDTDHVVVVASDLVGPGRDPIERRIREDGRDVRLVSVDACVTADDTAAASERSTGTIVVVQLDGAECGAVAGSDLVDAAAGRQVIVVSADGAFLDRMRPIAGIAVVDVRPLLGAQRSDSDQPCQWWDACPADGQVEVRDRRGALTAAGGERVGRQIVGALR